MLDEDARKAGTAKIVIREDWVSRQYGRKSAAAVLELELTTELPVSWCWQIEPIPDVAHFTALPRASIRIPPG